MTRNRGRIAAAVLAVILMGAVGAGCDTLNEKKAGNSGGGPQQVGQNTGNNMGGVP